MAKLVHHCPQCHKIAETQSEKRIIGKLGIRTYKCGHSERIDVTVAAKADTLDITSLDGKKLFEYQLVGARFIETANGRALLADEMGLGKTVQSLSYLVAHPECQPFVVFCKSGLRIQWNRECVRWGDFMCQVIDDTKPHFLKGFNGYIISMDSAWRIGTIKQKQGKKTVFIPDVGNTLSDQLQRLGVKTALIDECQLIKNPDSKRTQALRDVCREMKFVIGMSGTPIKNNTAEYFPILNILRPDKFPNYNQFVYGWCDTYWNGYASKTGGLKNPPKFLEYTKDFIMRRERKDVLPDLPQIWRNFSFHELGDAVEEKYKETVKEFMEFYGGDLSEYSSAQLASNILAYLSKMRHLTGYAKIEPVADFTEEFITSTDRKLAIFVHHKDVGQLLKEKLTNMAKEWPAEWGEGILELTSDMDAYTRDAQIQKWSSPKYRIMILSTLAGGEGLNLQFCSDCIMMERQWNPANEEQAEARFPRPGQTADKINATYFVAVGTVDEFFSELVEKKREIVQSTLAGRAVAWDQSSLVKELADLIMQKGGKKWGW